MPIPARILVILAHPDDEGFVAAGLARRLVERGAKVVLVTATRGDAGRVGDPPLCVRDALPALREAELRRAADILGISEVHLLDYQDTRLAEAPIDQIRGELVALIRRHRRCRRQRQDQAMVEPLVIPFVVVVRGAMSAGGGIVS